jgi:hypothetical protein
MNILEIYAFEYLKFAEQIQFYAVILFSSFALLFGFLFSVNLRIQRATYFLYASFIALCTVLSQFIWYFSYEAIANGYLHIISVLDIAVWAVSAYSTVVVTKARSNDAFGHSRLALLGFIPIANFWLLFTPSKDDNFNKQPWFLSGFAAVIIGLPLIVAPKIAELAIMHSIEARSYTVDSEISKKITERYLTYHLETGELKDAFKYLKSLEDIGSKIDEITILQDVKITESTYEIDLLVTDNNITGFTKEQLNIWENYVCKSYKQLIDVGASVIWHYQSDSVPTLALIIGNEDVCSY